MRVAGAEAALKDILGQPLIGLTYAEEEQVRAPVTVVYGSEDPQMTADQAAATAQRLRTTDVVPLAGANHLGMLSHPALLAEVLARAARCGSRLAAGREQLLGAGQVIGGVEVERLARIDGHAREPQTGHEVAQASPFGVGGRQRPAQRSARYTPSNGWSRPEGSTPITPSRASSGSAASSRGTAAPANGASPAPTTTSCTAGSRAATAAASPPPARCQAAPRAPIARPRGRPAQGDRAARR